MTKKEQEHLRYLIEKCMEENLDTYVCAIENSVDDVLDAIMPVIKEAFENGIDVVKGNATRCHNCYPIIRGNAIAVDEDDKCCLCGRQL